MWYEKVIEFDSLACGCPALLTTFIEKTALSLLYFLLHCRLIDHKSLGLFLGSLSCSIDLCVCFLCQYYTFFDYCSFEVQFEIMKRGISSFVLLSQDCFSYLVSFVFPYKFQNYLLQVYERMSLVFSQELNCICKLLWEIESFQQY